MMCWDILCFKTKMQWNNQGTMVCRWLQATSLDDQEELMSHTVATESVLLTSIIKAKE